MNRNVMGGQLVNSPSPLAGEGRERSRTSQLDPSDKAVGRAQTPSPQPSPARGEGARSLSDQRRYCWFNGIATSGWLRGARAEWPVAREQWPVVSEAEARELAVHEKRQNKANCLRC